ncbi:MAG TPA: bacillithiol transferase BstA [Thermoanaerobaculia bacterium]|nr:bacillithiol transferase BstA [Thermoanaerobaculia bacterium]
MADLRYPIGPYEAPRSVSESQIAQWIGEVEALPARMRSAVSGLTPEQLDTPYRPGGWTLRQVVHHVPDSHLNGYVRFKWALTEDEPAIKAYEEQLWAELADSRVVPVQTSLGLLEQLHARWTALLRSLTPGQWGRRYAHPVNGATELRQSIANYAWHGRHHLAHITTTIEREGWR